MVDDKIQIHFEYGKRQSFAGAVACFDHMPYFHKHSTAIQSEADDEIPFTVLNICHKNAVSRRRCFLYAYQITILVRDSKTNSIYPLIEPRVFSKIRFISINQKLIVLPGDQIKVRLVSKYSDNEALRLQPNIESSALPKPLSDRYHISYGNSNQFYTRLPCDDMKVADSLVCTNFEANCADGNDRILFAIQGAGDQFIIDKTCKDFLNGYANWAELER